MSLLAVLLTGPTPPVALHVVKIVALAVLQISCASQIRHHFMSTLTDSFPEFSWCCECSPLYVTDVFKISAVKLIVH